MSSSQDEGTCPPSRLPFPGTARESLLDSLLLSVWLLAAEPCAQVSGHHDACRACCLAHWWCLRLSLPSDCPSKPSLLPHHHLVNALTYVRLDEQTFQSCPLLAAGVARRHLRRISAISARREVRLTSLSTTDKPPCLAPHVAPPWKTSMRDKLEGSTSTHAISQHVTD